MSSLALIVTRNRMLRPVTSPGDSCRRRHSKALPRGAASETGSLL